MSDHRQQLLESLSAMMDGEASPLEVRRLLKEMEHDDELRAIWQRQHLASAAIARELPAQFRDLSSAISATVADEPHYAGVGSKNKPVLPHFFKPFGRVAIAASVAMVAVFGVNQWQAENTQSVENIAATSPEVVQSQQVPASLRPQVNAQAVTFDPTRRMASSPMIVMNNQQQQTYSEEEVRAYLVELMRRHATHTIQGSPQGVLPYNRIPEAAEDKE